MRLFLSNKETYYVGRSMNKCALKFDPNFG